MPVITTTIYFGASQGTYVKKYTHECMDCAQESKPTFEGIINNTKLETRHETMEACLQEMVKVLDRELDKAINGEITLRG